jgi:selenocysteine-specific elongation factor
VVDSLAAARAVRLRHRVVDAGVMSGVEASLQKALERFHDEQPLDEGMPREALREIAAPGAPGELFDAVVNALMDRRVIAGTERLRLQSRVVTLDPETTRARAEVERILIEAALTPPDTAALASAARLAPAKADQVIHLLVRERRLVRVGPLLFHANALGKLREDIAAMKPGTPEIGVATFKERYGLSRKFAIPLLEWLDRERVTRRVGERRIIL